ncbi:hypothetical protein HUE87_11120 [Candidatus Sulfurimonas marisnigri]|uniref:Porin n=1 Tax=Candidatus Sulfurimonas marisnigri TaxID=2740405 RepID=A0A7S7LZR2_9BACT|nr:porin [Candidatus Sulfurimonas marisnigri]QOY54412.1 hypothetical protein HUE87_11120 [Candidatus Sulfurimonas marisnigri]
MKKIVLSTMAVLAIGSASLSAAQFYVDDKGQLFTTPAEGRKAFEMANESKSNVSKITIVDKNSPDFLYGKQTHINMKFVADDSSDMWLKAGVRIQGTFENVETDYNDVSKTDTSINDAYLRRVRFEVAAGFNKWTSFVMDVRNDKANYQQSGENEFNVGDAYVQIKKPFGSSLVNFKLFRAKIDVSRTETIKSARTIAYDRPAVADAAAQFITHNRRGTNAQVFGDLNKKVHYQLAFGDATEETSLLDAKGKKTSEITEQSFFYGGKILLSPFDGWEETSKTETYFGVGKHFSFGAAYWVVPEIKADGAADSVTLNNKLVNLEASAHYKNFMIQGEYFKFDDVVKDWSAATIVTGKSSGWYVLSEYVMPELGYIAPFVRYESWDKFEDSAAGEDYKFTSKMAGVNWYLKGNTIKAGFMYQKDEYGASTGDKDVEKMKITTQFFF